MAVYEIKEIRIVASAPGVLVREFVFAPGEATPWHSHTQVADRCYGLAGAVAVERRGEPPVELGPGGTCETAAGVVHRIANLTGAEARVLLVQFGGAYDFISE